MSLNSYAKANNEYIKNYKNKALSYLKYWDLNNLYDWAMSQKLQVIGFKCFKDLSEFDEGFIKCYNENSKKGYFLEVNVQYPKELHDLHYDLPFT